MIERRDGRLVCECDECGTSTTGEIDDVRDWDEFRKAMKDAGWRTRKVDGDWAHLCPDC